MNHYVPLQFMHANLSRPVEIVAGTISAYHWSESTKCMVVYTTGGIFPVKESLEEIRQKIQQLNVTGGNHVTESKSEQRDNSGNKARPPRNGRKGT